MSHRFVSAYAVRLVDVDVSWGAAVPAPLRRVERFRGVVTTAGKSRHQIAPRKGIRNYQSQDDRRCDGGTVTAFATLARNIYAEHDSTDRERCTSVNIRLASRQAGSLTAALLLDVFRMRQAHQGTSNVLNEYVGRTRAGT